MTNTSEKYERTQQGNLLAFDMIKSTTKKVNLKLAVLTHVGRFDL